MRRPTPRAQSPHIHSPLALAVVHVVLLVLLRRLLRVLMIRLVLLVLVLLVRRRCLVLQRLVLRRRLM